MFLTRLNVSMFYFMLFAFLLKDGEQIKAPSWCHRPTVDQFNNIKLADLKTHCHMLVHMSWHGLSHRLRSCSLGAPHTQRPRISYIKKKNQFKCDGFAVGRVPYTVILWASVSSILQTKGLFGSQHRDKKDDVTALVWWNMNPVTLWMLLLIEQTHCVL